MKPVSCDTTEILVMCIWPLRALHMLHFDPYLGASSASSSHWRGPLLAGRSRWSCCPVRLSLWYSRFAALTLRSGTHRCWAQGTLSPPWCGHDARSEHRETHGHLHGANTLASAGPHGVYLLTVSLQIWNKKNLFSRRLTCFAEFD